ncbi:methyltransferase [Micromonospora sp. NPDC049559]|uniref:methyltransferase n=1 Tax=Micromonospora sp. NPDC049559 TaxID=3155923 RepID=UPI00343AD936
MSELFGIVWGYSTSAVVNTALELRLPDLLGTQARSSKELATETGTHEPSLNRLLRAMSSLGVTKETEPGTFALTPAGALLRRDAENSMWSLASLLLHESMWRPWQQLTESVRTGEPTFEPQFGVSYWTYMREHPEVSSVFNGAMGNASQDVGAAMAATYDFSRFGTALDIGGGNGTLLAAILRATPGLRGIVFDSESGVAEAPGYLAEQGVADRCDIRSGSFLEEIPTGGDIHIVKSVIHDWDDERAAAILRNSRRALPADGRLLIVEPVLPPPPVTVTPQGPFAYLNDLNMMISLRGKERTEAEYDALLSATGFRKTAVVPMSGYARVNIIEAVVAP